LRLNRYELIQLSLERRFFLPKKPRRFECVAGFGATGLDVPRLDGAWFDGLEVCMGYDLVQRPYILMLTARARN